MIENHLTSQPLSKRLKELKVPQVSEFYWQECADSTNNWSFGKTTTNYGLPVENYYSAFLSSELLDLAPASTSLLKRTDKDGKNPRYYVETFEHYRDSDWHENPAEALGLMLEYLILNGLIKL